MQSNKLKYKILVELRANKAFWSYDILPKDEIPAALIIEQCLKYGSWEAILMLFKVYSHDFIKSTWDHEMAREINFHQLNVFLARIFFEINDPEGYLKNLRASYLAELERRELPIDS